MARGRARWKRYVDPKTYLTRAMVGLETAAPGIAGALGYYSILRPPSRLERLAEISIASPAADPPYAAAYRTLTIANVDTPTGQLGHPGHADLAPGTPSLGPLRPLETRLFAGVVPDVVVPGHTLMPADGRTGRLLSAYMSGHVNWGLAYPQPPLRTVRLPGLAWAVPPVRNYFHLLIEHILPALDALIRVPDLARGEPVSVIVSQRLPTVAYSVELMGALGIPVEIVRAKPFTAYRPERYLFAKPISATVEHFYAYTQTVAALREAAARRGDAPPPSERLYIPRTGTRIRRLETEGALMAALEARGFAPFAANWSNIDRQVATFLGAREIVSVHGAALTNIVWAGAEARVVEIFPVNARKTTYLHMAALHGQGYAPVIGGPEDETQSFSAPVESVLEALR